MIVLTAVLAHSGLFLSVGGGLALGPFSPWILAISSVFVGSVASAADYQVWIQRFFWLLAVVVGFLALPEVLAVGVTQMPEQTGIGEAWAIVAVGTVPIGLVIGAVRVWL